MSDEVLLEIKNCIAKITFNRPESLNAMNDQFAKLLIKFCTPSVLT